MTFRLWRCLYFHMSFLYLSLSLYLRLHLIIHPPGRGGAWGKGGRVCEGTPQHQFSLTKLKPGNDSLFLKNYY